MLKRDGFSIDVILWSLIGAMGNILRPMGASPAELMGFTQGAIRAVNAIRSRH